MEKNNIQPFIIEKKNGEKKMVLGRIIARGKWDDIKHIMFDENELKELENKKLNDEQ